MIAFAAGVSLLMAGHSSAHPLGPTSFLGTRSLEASDVGSSLRQTTASLPEKPLMSPKEIALLSKYMSKATSYMEWGAGGSTFFVVSNFPNIVHMRSIENDVDWVDTLKGDARIRDAIADGRLELDFADTGRVRNPGYPVNHRHAGIPAYSGAIQKDSASNYDLILIDGRFRVACFLKALRDAPGSPTLMIHDYGREPYHVVEEFADIVERTDHLVVLRAIQPLDTARLEEMIDKYEYQAAV